MGGGGRGWAFLSLRPWLVLFKLVKGCKIYPEMKQRGETVKEDVGSAEKRWSRNRALAFPAVFLVSLWVVMHGHKQAAPLPPVLFLYMLTGWGVAEPAQEAKR